MSDSQHLLQSVEHGVATLTLNRLSAHNAFDASLIRALQTALDQLATDPTVRLLKITANGKFFCAGGDLHWFKNATQLSPPENRADAALLAGLLRTLNLFPKPTLAVIQGPAFGGGVGLIACCDIAVAAQSAAFALSEVKLGLVPATIAPYVLRAIGARQLRRYALTAEMFTAHDAQRMGLVHTVVEDSALTHTTEALAASLLRNGPIAMTTTKRLVEELSVVAAGELEKTAELLAQIRVSHEAQEGLTAFFEKREAVW